MRLRFSTVRPLLRLAIREDIGKGDITSKKCVPRRTQARAEIIAKQAGILCGTDIVEYAFRLLDPSVFVKIHHRDGTILRRGMVIAMIWGRARSVLAAERTILNFLQQLSGVATQTREYMQALEHTNVILLDTRKTMPGMRYLQKYAVRIGGAQNHRQGLYDRVLIKDNHIAVNGSITNAVRKTKKRNRVVEVECSTFEQVKEALTTECDWIMLDNMGLRQMNKAMKLIDGKKKVELSGGITKKNIRHLAALGPDFISVGALTHSAPAINMGIEVKKR